MSFASDFHHTFASQPEIGSSSAMPILVSHSDSFPPRPSTSTQLSGAIDALSFAAFDLEATSFPVPHTTTAEFPVATDTDHDLAAWRELWDLPPSASENPYSFLPAVDRRFSGSEASEFDSLPELEYSTSPDQSPASLYETCSTPPQECVNAVCDVPLLAPRPLPCIPPSLFQFDFLPNEKDEDPLLLPHTQMNRSKEHGSRKRRRSPSPPPPLILARPWPHVAPPAHVRHVAPPPHDAKRRRAFVVPAADPGSYAPQARHVDVSLAQAPHVPHAERFVLPNASSNFRTVVGWV